MRLLGTNESPRYISELLEHGPKYCVQTKPEKAELLSVVRNNASKGKCEHRDRCVFEDVEVLRVCGQAGGGRTGTSGRMIRYLRDNNLRLLQADKEGGFVIVKDEDFCKKGLEAVAKDFCQVTKAESSTKMKAAVANVCETFQVMY